MEHPADIVLLIGHGSLDEDGMAESRRFAQLLASHLATPIEPGFLELADPPLVDGIAACVARGPQRIIALPLLLGPAGHHKNDIPALLQWARTQWPRIEFRYGAPLGAQYPLVRVLADRAADAIAAARPCADAETALLLVGRGSHDPDSNSELAKIARLVWEGRAYGWVETAYYSLTGPDVQAGIMRCARLGARRVVVLPYLLFNGRICRFIGEQARKLQDQLPAIEIVVGEHLGLHPGVLAAVAQRYREVVDGTVSMTCDLCKYRQPMPGFEAEYGIPQITDHQHGMRGMVHRHGAPAALSILPPRYQGNLAINAAPMPAAELVFDAQGRVAWDRIWGLDDPGSPFCELALAGGPPHRGELLEPVAPDTVQADQERYTRVLMELLRGIHMTTGMKGVISRAPGWVGVQCASEAMALWLLRAIVVENISVRREGAVLFLPAGPRFRLEHEIRNVITALAKTHHYWTEHLARS
jgi:sirohydrochlorin cobaltochelatase